MANYDDHLVCYREFFENFAKTVNPQDQLPVKLGSYKLINLEVVGGVIDWTTQYLTQKQCPQSLLAPLIQLVIEETRKICKKHPVQCGFNPTSNAYEPLKLMQTVMAKTNEICLRYLDNSMLCSLPAPGPPYNTVSMAASKNKRRRMEDRHVVIHDLNTMFNIKEASPSSYYAIFDGHAGHDAAAYSAAHLHQYLAESKYFATNPEQALLDAFCKTDTLFIEKCKVESFSSGTTAVCALLKPKENTLYIAWVGDSQAFLVNQGRILQCVKPHKPFREDEKKRIESEGGFVSFWGTWRVNGQLAVSRAIGDPDYKPFVTAIPEIREIQLDGGEDFLILGCDGMWDFVSEDETALAVYNLVCQNPDQTDRIGEHLVKLAKESDSSDNITVIVVFLREPSKIAAEAHWANRNGSPIAMDTSLDNANNPFANSNGSDNKTTTTTTTTPSPPPPASTVDTDSFKTDGFLLNLSTENNFKQNGSDVDDLLSSPTNDFYQKLEKPYSKRSASEFDDDDDDDDDDDVDIEVNNDNIIDNDNERDRDDNDDDDDDDVVDDLGPETDVDTADVLSPSMITAKALADGIINNNPEGSFNPFIEKEEVEKAALEIDGDLQKQQNDDKIEHKSPIVMEDEKHDNLADMPVQDVGGSLDENVADSGDDSADEWSYFKGEEANKENISPEHKPEQEVAASIEDNSDNMSQLNPNAAEFVPVSPTRSIPSPACQALINDPVITQSPNRAPKDYDINLPNPQEFEKEIKSRPSEVETCDSNGHEELIDPQQPQELENLLNGKNIDEIPEFQPSTVLTPTKATHDEFHFGPNAAPFTPIKLLDQSEAALSTKAIYGDESTATIQSFDESAFGQDNVDFTTSTLNKELDPMSMSFYQEKPDINDLNRVQVLPDNLDEFLMNASNEQSVQLDNANTIKTYEIINLDNDERVQTTDLDKIVDDEKDIASPVDNNDSSDGVCELSNSPDLISNEIIDKKDEEEKEKDVDEEKMDEVAEKPEKEEDEKEKEIEAVCDRIVKSPELLAVSPTPESIQNQDNLETNQLITIEDKEQPQLLGDLVELKTDSVQEALIAVSPVPTHEESVTAASPVPTHEEPATAASPVPTHKEPATAASPVPLQEQQPTAASPLPTHELLSSPEVPVETSMENQSDITASPEPTVKHQEAEIIMDSFIDDGKKEDSTVESPVEVVTSSMSPIPDQELAPVSEQETAPVCELSPTVEQQQQQPMEEISGVCESVETTQVNSFLEGSEIADVHSPLEASPAAAVAAQLPNDGNNESVISDQGSLLDLDHPLSKCVYPLPAEHQEILKTEEVIVDKVEDDKKVEVVAEKVVEEEIKQTETVAEVAPIAVAAAATAAVVGTAAAATAATTDKKTTKPAVKKAPASKLATTKTTTAAKPATTKPATSRPAATKLSSPAAPKPTSASKIAVTNKSTSIAKVKTSATTVASKTSIDKKPMVNGTTKTTKPTTAAKTTTSTTATTKSPSSTRPISSTLTKTSPTKPRPTTAPTSRVISSTTSKTSNTTTTTTTAAKSRPATLAPKTAASTTRTGSTSSTASKTTLTKTASSTTAKTLSSPRAPRPPTTTTTAKPRVPLTKTITKTQADTEKQHKESANKLTASRSTTTATTKTTARTITHTVKKAEAKSSGSTTTVTKTTAITGKKPTEICNVKTTKTTKIEKPVQNGISSVVTEQIIVDNEPQLVKDNSPVDNKLIVEANATD